MSESDGPTRENSSSSVKGPRPPSVVHEAPSTLLQSFTQTTLAQRINSAFGSFRDRKNKLQDNSILNGVGGLRVGSKGQLEVDKSIWDVTKGVQVEEEKTSAIQRAWEAVCQDVKTVATTVRRDPLVAIIPFVLMLMLMGGGLWAIYASAAKETEHRRSVALQTVRDKGLYLETELAKAFLPAYVCSVYVRRDPSWPAVNQSFEPMALEMIRLSNAGSVLTLSLIPNGVIYTMVPLKGSQPEDDPNWRAIGKDWLQDRYNQDKVYQAISTGNLTIIGPYNLTQGGIGLVAMLSINVADAAPNATFDIPPYQHGALGLWQTPNRTQYGPNLTGTPFAPYMYNETTSKKWWGLTTVLISWDRLRENVTRLQDLESQGYEYVLSRPVLRKELLQARPDLANGTHQLAVAWSDAVQPVPANATNNKAPATRPGKARPLMYYDLHERLDRPVSTHIYVEGAEMDLYVTLASGWTPSWKKPVVAVTIVLAVLVSLLLFLVLVNRRQHVRLLHAMIPKKVISTLRRGKVFTESFEVVTVLFSDIVSYTTMSATMKPIEVVQMLDELYQEFDNLAEKHRLYKLDTIGDAFMLVGGAPDKEGAAAAAARVAQMGLDMIKITSTKVLAGGHVVRIRVGIHSGPAVAAVVGRKAPKYTLFGDTVNTASRMESNGSPMRIHVSGATADLLNQAGGFIIESRGEIPIKGKGVMATFWVTGTHAWDMGPCRRSESVDISHITANLATAAATASNKIPENAEGERAAQKASVASSSAAAGPPTSTAVSSPFPISAVPSTSPTGAAASGGGLAGLAGGPGSSAGTVSLLAGPLPVSGLGSVGGRPQGGGTARLAKSSTNNVSSFIAGSHANLTLNPLAFQSVGPPDGSEGDLMASKIKSRDFKDLVYAEAGALCDTHPADLRSSARLSTQGTPPGPTSTGEQQPAAPEAAAAAVTSKPAAAGSAGASGSTPTPRPA